MVSPADSLRRDKNGVLKLTLTIYFSHEWRMCFGIKLSVFNFVKDFQQGIESRGKLLAGTNTLQLNIRRMHGISLEILKLVPSDHLQSCVSGKY